MVANRQILGTTTGPVAGSIGPFRGPRNDFSRDRALGFNALADHDKKSANSGLRVGGGIYPAGPGAGDKRGTGPAIALPESVILKTLSAPYATMAGA